MFFNKRFNGTKCVFWQAKEEEDLRPKKPLQRKTVKTTEEGNAILHGKRFFIQETPFGD